MTIRMQPEAGYRRANGIMRHEICPLLYVYAANGPSQVVDALGELAIDTAHRMQDCILNDNCNCADFEDALAAANCALSAGGACTAWMNANGCGGTQTAYLDCSAMLFDLAVCYTLAGGGGYVIRGSSTITVCPQLCGQGAAFIGSILIHEAIHTCGWFGHNESKAVAGQAACLQDLLRCLPSKCRCSSACGRH